MRDNIHWTMLESGSERLYQITFEACKRNSLAKIQSGNVLAVLLKNMLEQNLLTKESLNITDLGSDDATTLIDYIRKSDLRNTKLNITAIDIKDKAVEEAENNLQQARHSILRNLSRFNAIQGNIYDNDLSSKIGDGISDITFISHVAYVVSQEEINNLLNNVNQTMSETGIVIALHVQDSKNSFVDLRNRFGQRADINETNSDKNKVSDPSQGIMQAAQHNDMHIVNTKYNSSVTLHQMSDEDWESLKDPSKFAELPPHLEENLKTLAFITLRSPSEMALDSSERGLNSYIDTVKEIVIQSNNQGRDGGFIHATVAIQVIANSKATETTKNAQSNAVSELEKNIREIASSASRSEDITIP